MSHVSNSSNKPQKHYFVTRARDGNPKLSSCSPPAGYSTVARAKKAEIKEIREEISFHLETISGLLNDIKDAKEQQGRASLYCEINAVMEEIEKAKKNEEKVRGLSLEDGSL
jgi:hypothetical protein